MKVFTRKPTTADYVIVLVLAAVISAVALAAFCVAGLSGITMPPGTTVIFLGVVAFALCALFIPRRVKLALFRIMGRLLRAK